METYATALLYAIPFFIVLVLLEVGYGALVKNQKHRLMDTVSSLSSGLTNIIKDSLGFGTDDDGALVTVVAVENDSRCAEGGGGSRGSRPGASARLRTRPAPPSPSGRGGGWGGGGVSNIIYQIKELEMS